MGQGGTAVGEASRIRQTRARRIAATIRLTAIPRARRIKRSGRIANGSRAARSRDQQQWDQQQWDQQRGMGMQQQRGQQPMSASDLALAHRIAMQLQQQLTTDKTIQVMDPQAIYVHVSQGTVKLHGSVQDNNQRQSGRTDRPVRSRRAERAEPVAGRRPGRRVPDLRLRPRTDGSEPAARPKPDRRQSQWDSSSRQGQTGSTSRPVGPEQHREPANLRAYYGSAQSCNRVPSRA